MAKLFWHKIDFNCPRCKEDLQITELLASADGEVVIENYCEPCNIHYKFKTDVGRILAYCRVADKVNNDAEASKPNQPLRPPLSLPPPSFTDIDRSLGHGLGLDMEAT